MYTVQGCRGLKLILDHIRLEAGYNLDSSLLHHKASTHCIYMQRQTTVYTYIPTYMGN